LEQGEENDRLWGLRKLPLDLGPRCEYHRLIGGHPSPGRWRPFRDHPPGLGEPVGLLLIAKHLIQAVVFDHQKVEIVRWIP